MTPVRVPPPLAYARARVRDGALEKEAAREAEQAFSKEWPMPADEIEAHLVADGLNGRRHYPKEDFS